MKSREIVTYVPIPQEKIASCSVWAGEQYICQPFTLQVECWEVHLDRANNRTISDLSEFNLLCVGSPTYSGSPRPPIVNYINRCSNLENRVCLVFATGSSNPEEANKKMQSLLEAKGAKVVGSLALLTKQKDEVDELTREFVEKIVKLTEDGN